MDSLLDEEILVSSGWSSRETLRPLAYSTLADLAHHVRAQLSLPQVCKILKISYFLVQIHSLFHHIMISMEVLHFGSSSFTLLQDFLIYFFPHQLASAVHLFSKNVHDESLPCSIQTMSCKLLLNLVEGITKKSESEKSPVS